MKRFAQLNGFALALFLAAPVAAAAPADFDSELSCYFALVGKTQTLQNGTDLLYKKGSTTPFKVMRRNDAGAGGGLFVYSRTDVIFLRVPTELKSSGGKIWMTLPIPGLDSQKFAVLEQPNNLSAFFPESALPDRKAVNAFTVIKEADTGLARKILRSHLESGILSVHTLYESTDGPPGKASKKDILGALQKCLGIPSQTLRPMIRAEMAKFGAF